jgi:hypothetical protein
MKIDFKDNSEVLKKVIEKILFPKYDKLDYIDDISVSSSSFRGDRYFVDIFTKECLTDEEMMKIDTEAKTLFKMISLSNVSDDPFNIGGNKVMLFFDCGDGEGYQFKSTIGYTH